MQAAVRINISQVQSKGRDYNLMRCTYVVLILCCMLPSNHCDYVLNTHTHIAHRYPALQCTHTHTHTHTHICVHVYGRTQNADRRLYASEGISAKKLCSFGLFYENPIECTPVAQYRISGRIIRIRLREHMCPTYLHAVPAKCAQEPSDVPVDALSPNTPCSPDIHIRSLYQQIVFILILTII